MTKLQNIKQKYRGYEYYLDRWLCHKLLGHGAGIKHVTKGRLEKMYAKKVTRPRSEEARALGKHGFIGLGKIYSDKLVQNIRDEIEAAFQDEEKHGKPNDWMRTLFFPTKNAPSTRALITKDIIDIVEEHYQTHARVSTIICKRNIGPPEGVDTRNLFSNNWHFDYASTSIIKLFVCISDITEQDGPFHIYPTPQTRNLVRMGYKTRENYAGASLHIENYKNLQRLTGPGGTAALCNTEVNLHKAGVPEHGHHRDIIQFQFVPSNKPVPSNWYDELDLKGLEQKVH